MRFTALPESKTPSASQKRCTNYSVCIHAHRYTELGFRLCVYVCHIGTESGIVEAIGWLLPVVEPGDTQQYRPQWKAPDSAEDALLLHVLRFEDSRVQSQNTGS